MTRIAFVDRDGTIIEEPADFQIDSVSKLRFVADVIPALLRIQQAGFELVMVSNQDGLGTASFPREDFEPPHALMMHVLESQGIRFREILIDPSLPIENSSNRKPGLGMVMHYLRDRSIDLANSVVIGDRDTDLQFASNLGARGIKIGADLSWQQIAHELVDAPRVASVSRRTKETRIEVRVDLDQARDPMVSTGLPFFDHMLEQLGKHGGFTLDLRCEGDLQIDEHHTVEDCALALGQALRQALGDKRGIARYGFADGEGVGNAEDGEVTAPRTGYLLPMDETIARAALDFSGRPYFVFEGQFGRERVGDLPTELVPHFFRSLCETAGLNLHLSVRGDNAHHMVEASFKAVARALRVALRREGRDLPSTKGTL